MGRKIAILVACISILIAIGFTWILTSNCHYVGLDKIGVEKARQLQIDKSVSSSNNIQVTAYNDKSDDIYVSYNFWGNEKDAVKYGIPNVDKDYSQCIGTTVGLLVIGVFIITMILIFTIEEK